MIYIFDNRTLKALKENILPDEAIRFVLDHDGCDEETAAVTVDCAMKTGDCQTQTLTLVVS